MYETAPIQANEYHDTTLLCGVIFMYNVRYQGHLVETLSLFSRTAAHLTQHSARALTSIKAETREFLAERAVLILLRSAPVC